MIVVVLIIMILNKNLFRSYDLSDRKNRRAIVHLILNNASNCKEARFMTRS